MANTDIIIAAKLDRLTSALSRASTRELETSLSARAGHFTASETLCIRMAHKALHAHNDDADEVVQAWEGEAGRLADSMMDMSRREIELFNLADCAIESLIRTH